MTEIRWTSGQEEYTVAEIEYMLSSQRAMIYNDLKSLLANYAHNLSGISGVLTSEGKEVLAYLSNPRTVEI